MATFDQRGQQVTYQYNAAGNINIGAVESAAEFERELGKLRDEVDKAGASGALKKDVALDAKYQLDKAAQQTVKPSPDSLPGETARVDRGSAGVVEQEERRMRVVEVADLSGPDAVRLGERPEPEGSGVLVGVRAIGLSFPDLLRSRGEYQVRLAPPYVLGQELSGEVIDAPEGSGFKVGDRVAGMMDGAAAERVRIDPSSLIALPDHLTFEQGSGALFNYQTALLALEIRGRLKAGEVVLAHGAGGGTGTAVVQVAKAIGARVIGVVSSDEKAEAARQAGADEIVRSDGAWKDAALELTGGRGVDLVFDPVGGDRMLDTIRALAYGGRWVIIGFTGGSIPQVPTNRLLLKNVEVVGSYLGGYTQSVPDGRVRLLERIKAMLQDGSIAPIVGSTFPMERGTDALRELGERRARGKVVLRVG